MNELSYAVSGMRCAQQLGVSVQKKLKCELSYALINDTFTLLMQARLCLVTELIFRWATNLPLLQVATDNAKLG